MTFLCTILNIGNITYDIAYYPACLSKKSDFSGNLENAQKYLFNSFISVNKIGVYLNRYTPTMFNQELKRFFFIF